MTPLHSPQHLPAQLAEPVSLHRLFLGYEDFQSEKRARHACRLLAEFAGADHRVRVEEWKLDLLQNRSMRAMATEVAGASSLLVLALQEGAAVPHFVIEWLQTGFGNGATPARTLLILMGPSPEPPESAAPEATGLRELTAKAGLSLYQIPLDGPTGRWDEPGYASAALSRVAQAVFQR